jgi:peptidoglycan/LPS O-acetylase OafA/YrhL
LSLRRKHKLEEQKSQRLDYLDALRGLAAISVFFYHFFGWKWEKTSYFHASAFVFNGSDAVSFFFVLSGFVLSFAFIQRNEPIPLKKFIVKRLLRLYPAYLCVVFLNYLYWNRHALDLKLLNDIFYLNGQQLWQELILVRGNHKFYIPGWTLEVEMALSLLVPFLVILGRNNVKYLWFLLPISIFMGGSISIFIFHFILGVLLAYYYPKITEYNIKTHKWYKNRWLIYIAIFLLFSIRQIDKISPIGPSFMNLLKFLGIDFFHFTGFAAACIILIAIQNKSLQKIMQIKPFLFLGKISYSIYLMHWLIVVYVMEHWEKWLQLFPTPQITFFAMLLISFLATIISATMLYYTVERPFINLGKKINL